MQYSEFFEKNHMTRLQGGSMAIAVYRGIIGVSIYNAAIGELFACSLDKEEFQEKFPEIKAHFKPKHAYVMPVNKGAYEDFMTTNIVLQVLKDFKVPYSGSSLAPAAKYMEIDDGHINFQTVHNVVCERHRNCPDPAQSASLALIYFEFKLKRKRGSDEQEAS